MKTPIWTGLTVSPATVACWTAGSQVQGVQDQGVPEQRLVPDPHEDLQQGIGGQQGEVGQEEGQEQEAGLALRVSNSTTSPIFKDWILENIEKIQ